MADNYASLAASTGTAIDSASKHNRQCKVSTDHMLQWVQDSITTGDSAQQILKKDKMNYCMHKVRGMVREGCVCVCVLGMQYSPCVESGRHRGCRHPRVVWNVELCRLRVSSGGLHLRQYVGGGAVLAHAPLQQCEGHE
jgi:hypothetical protein